MGEYTPQQGSVESRSETVVQACAERGEVAACVVDVLEGGLQSDVAVQLATVCQLNGLLGIRPPGAGGLGHCGAHTPVARC